MREAQILPLVRGELVATVIRDSDPPPPRGSISGDSIQDRTMAAALRGTTSPALMSQGNVAPQIEALEPECWGVSWGVAAACRP
jgi:hypothetical protein